MCIRDRPQGERATTRTAALINGTASHIIEFDDIYRDGLFHPGSPIISAALAVAEMVDSSGIDLLHGIIAGYDVANSIAEAINPHHYDWGHTTATVGFLGASTSSAVQNDSATVLRSFFSAPLQEFLTAPQKQSLLPFLLIGSATLILAISVVELLFLLIFREAFSKSSLVGFSQMFTLELQVAVPLFSVQQPSPPKGLEEKNRAGEGSGLRTVGISM